MNKFKPGDLVKVVNSKLDSYGSIGVLKAINCNGNIVVDHVETDKKFIYCPSSAELWQPFDFPMQAKASGPESEREKSEKEADDQIAIWGVNLKEDAQSFCNRISRLYSLFDRHEKALYEGGKRIAALETRVAEMSGHGCGHG